MLQSSNMYGVPDTNELYRLILDVCHSYHEETDHTVMILYIPQHKRFSSIPIWVKWVYMQENMVVTQCNLYGQSKCLETSFSTYIPGMKNGDGHHCGKTTGSYKHLGIHLSKKINILSFIQKTRCHIWGQSANRLQFSCNIWCYITVKMNSIK
jgi:hypothetical protein